MQGKITYPYGTPTVQYWVRDQDGNKPVKIIQVKAEEAEKVKLELESKGYVVI